MECEKINLCLSQITGNATTAFKLNSQIFIHELKLMISVHNFALVLPATFIKQGHYNPKLNFPKQDVYISKSILLYLISKENERLEVRDLAISYFQETEILN